MGFWTIAAKAGSAGGGLAGLFGLIGRKKRAKRLQEHDYAMQDRGHQYDQEMAQYAYNQELNAWNLSNQYNTPKSQMERLKEAGLNPNLVYGKGIENVGKSTLPGYDAPTADFSGVRSGLPSQTTGQMLSGALSQYLDLKTKAANIDSINANNKIANIEYTKRGRESMNLLEKQALMQQEGSKRAVELDLQQKLKTGELGKYSLENEQNKIDMAISKLMEQKSTTKIKGKEQQFFEASKGAGPILQLLKLIFGK